MILRTSSPRVVSHTDYSRPFWPGRVVTFTQQRLSKALGSAWQRHLLLLSLSPNTLLLTRRNSLLPQGLYRYRFLSLGHSPLHSFRFLFKCHFIRKTSLCPYHPT